MYENYGAEDMCGLYGVDCEAGGGEQRSGDDDDECAIEGLSFIGISFSVNTANGNPHRINRGRIRRRRRFDGLSSRSGRKRNTTMRTMGLTFDDLSPISIGKYVYIEITIRNIEMFFVQISFILSCISSYVSFRSRKTFLF